MENAIDKLNKDKSISRQLRTCRFIYIQMKNVADKTEVLATENNDKRRFDVSLASIGKKERK